MDHIPKTRITHSLIFGIAFFIIGLIIDDVYTVIAGALLIAVWTIIETGEKVIQHIHHPPKPL